MIQTFCDICGKLVVPSDDGVSAMKEIIGRLYNLGGPMYSTVLTVSTPTRHTCRSCAAYAVEHGEWPRQEEQST